MMIPSRYAFIVALIRIDIGLLSFCYLAYLHTSISMTSSVGTSILQKLLDANLLHVDDQVEFTFKKHKFGATISDGALIAQCTWNGTPIRQTGFKTLTDWCDTCIQELVNEYVTRFSSWKRVRHVRTQRSFTQLRELLLPRSCALAVATRKCTCTETKIQRRRIVILEQQIMQLKAKLKSQSSNDNQIVDNNPFKLQF